MVVELSEPVKGNPGSLELFLRAAIENEHSALVAAYEQQALVDEAETRRWAVEVFEHCVCPQLRAWFDVEPHWTRKAAAEWKQGESIVSYRGLRLRAEEPIAGVDVEIKAREASDYGLRRLVLDAPDSFGALVLRPTDETETQVVAVGRFLLEFAERERARRERDAESRRGDRERREKRERDDAERARHQALRESAEEECARLVESRTAVARAEIAAEMAEEAARLGWPEGATLALKRIRWFPVVDQDNLPIEHSVWAVSVVRREWYVTGVCPTEDGRVAFDQRAPNGYIVEDAEFTNLDDLPEDWMRHRAYYERRVSASVPLGCDCAEPCVVEDAYIVGESQWLLSPVIRGLLRGSAE